MPTAPSINFKFFLKSINLKLFEISPNSHSTDTRRELIAQLNSFITSVSSATSPIRYVDEEDMLGLHTDKGFGQQNYEHGVQELEVNQNP